MSDEPTKNIGQKYDSKPTVETVLQRIAELGEQLNARMNRFEERIEIRLNRIESEVKKTHSEFYELRADFKELRAEFKEFRSHFKEPA